ncbi:tetratricopeptide TPR_4 containing protein [Oscillochloris trichoides DG-6]|uniref:Tetratricopeptide TPR_4 containing protein n=1 Tax=Oscillochloris trichoides DG-6 TaxID=765420 RepID=E1IGJ5_9CHLR|nr:tetratricopeptide TPR_4 containing protein [Oscillochloris trichoides DG-6]
MGEDRLGRQQIATQRGMAVIQDDPGRFLHKAGGELKKLFALEFSDDMLARPAIWVRPLEVWVRLGLGDGLWLLILLAGVIGMGQRTTQGETPRSVWTWFLHTFSQPRWLLLPWVLYVALTTLIFHVELRYRLPLYPALLAYSGLVLTSRQRPAWPGLLAALLCLSITLLHANYPALAWQLANKHLQLARAEAALNRGDAVAAEAAAQSAITWDNDSALAHVALARAAMARGENQAAMVYLDTAIKLLPAHPYAHLLRGDLLRSAGESASARSDLAYETSALEDLQSWAWQRFVSPSPSQISLGDGLDLGFIRGFHHLATGETGFRWSHGTAYVRLHAAAGANQIQIQAASGRPDGSATRVQVRVDGRVVGAIMVSAAGDTYHLNLPQPISSPGDVVISLESPTFTPRDYDRASGDGRRLGVQVYAVGL